MIESLYGKIMLRQKIHSENIISFIKISYFFAKSCTVYQLFLNKYLKFLSVLTSLKLFYFNVFSHCYLNKN